MLHHLMQTTYCKLVTGRWYEHRFITVKAIRTIPKGVDPFLGRKIKCITLPRDKFNELPRDVQMLIEQHFTADMNGNFGVPEHGLNEMNLSFYVNFARAANATPNLIEVDGDDVSTFQSMITTRTVHAGEEILLPMPETPTADAVPFSFAASPVSEVDQLVERLWACNVVLRVSTVQNGGLGVFALQDMFKGERPFPVLHQSDTIDIPRELATRMLSDGDNLAILQLLNDYFVEADDAYPVLPTGINDIDSSFYINSAPRRHMSNLMLVDDPNSAYKEWATSRVIRKGEELFEQYGDMDMELPGDGRLLPGNYASPRSSMVLDDDRYQSRTTTAGGTQDMLPHGAGPSVTASAQDAGPSSAAEAQPNITEAAEEEEEEETEGLTAAALGKRKARD